jgi:prepilin-type N-terminal cleavage/methylation domain-containing protein
MGITIKNNETKRKGLTLVESLLVITIFGLLLAVVIPRGMRLMNEAKFSLVRQAGSEIGARVVAWVQTELETRSPERNVGLLGLMVGPPDPESADENHPPGLVHKYTGDPAFDKVAALMEDGLRPVNPFNEADYFSSDNDDSLTPSPDPGLLFLAVERPEPNRTALNFYFIWTAFSRDGKGAWYGELDHLEPAGVRRGMFVTRMHGQLPARLLTGNGSGVGSTQLTITGKEVE